MNGHLRRSVDNGIGDSGFYEFKTATVLDNKCICTDRSCKFYKIAEFLSFLVGNNRIYRYVELCSVQVAKA